MKWWKIQTDGQSAIKTIMPLVAPIGNTVLICRCIGSILFSSITFALRSLRRTDIAQNMADVKLQRLTPRRTQLFETTMQFLLWGCGCGTQHMVLPTICTGIVLFYCAADPWTYEVKPTSQPTKHLGRLPASCFQFGVNVPNRYCHKFYFLANLLFLFALRAGTGCAKSPRCVDLIFFRFIGVRSTFYFVLLLPLLSIVSFVESVFQLLFWTSLQKICAFRSLCYRWHKLPLGVLTFWVYAEASY